jgi:hypothetical protein
VQFKKPTLENLPVLNVLELEDNQLSQLASVYDEFRNSDLQVLHSLTEDPVRIEFDNAIASIFSLPSISPLRSLLAREPFISDESLVSPERDTTVEDECLYHQLTIPWVNHD